MENVSTGEIKDAPRRRVLVVEDNADAAEMLRDLLELAGHEVLLTENGRDALSLLHEHGADIVLCDLGLPGMSGYELAREIRASAQLRTIPLIAITGYSQPQDRKHTAELGFDEHLIKPWAF